MHNHNPLMSAGAAPSPETVQARFEHLAALHPQRTALVVAGRSLTYQELNARANRCARFLIQRCGANLGVDRLVAIQVGRDVETVVTLLAILKTGAAYLPIDPTLPAARVRSMLSAARPVLLIQEYDSHDWSDLVPVLSRDVLVTQSSPLASSDLGLPCTDGDLAYVIYTSGSEGTPKGVMVEHRGVVNLARAQQLAFGAGVDTKVLQFYSFAFDASVFEAFMALLNGGTLVLEPRESLLDVDELHRLIRGHGITSLQLPPAVLAALRDDGLDSLKTVMVGGEVYPDHVVARWRRRCRVFNVYGPTEATCWSTFHESIEPETPLPIGLPIPGAQVHLLDEQLREVGPEESGEIFLGGLGVARGYLGDEQQTRQRFLTLADDTRGVRLYRTGDLARRKTDGSLIFLGRSDQQVKIRGYRVELSEIEAALLRCPEIAEAVCRVYPQSEVSAGELFAYVVLHPGAAATAQDLVGRVSARLRAVLPVYMLPDAFVVERSLPRLANDKVDRRALPAPVFAIWPSATVGGCPETPAERLVETVFREVLARDTPIGVGASFFDIGGHSLRVVSVLSRLRERCGAAPRVSEFYARPTIRGVAALLGDVQFGPSPTVSAPVTAKAPKTSALSAAQRQVWFIEQSPDRSPAYNVPFAYRLRGRLDVASLQAAIGDLQRRHASLRAHFTWSGGELRQTFDAPLCGLVHVDRRGTPDAHEAARQDVAVAARALFDLATEPPLRATLQQLGDDEWLLLFVVHHLAADGWSARIFLRELGQLYRRQSGETTAELEPPGSYADYVAWQNEWLRSDVAEEQRRYWSALLTGAPPALTLPLADTRPRERSLRGGRIPLRLRESLARALEAIASQLDTSCFTVLLAAFQVLLHRYAAQEDFVLGTVSASRPHSSFENTVGFFANALAVRGRVLPETTFAELVREVRTAVLAAFDHQDLPFEEVIKVTSPERTLAHTPLFQHMFVYQGEALGELSLPGLDCVAVDVDTGTSKYDLTLELSRSTSGLAGFIEYNADIWDASRVAHMAGHFCQLLETIVVDPSQRVGSLDLAAEPERKMLEAQTRARIHSFEGARRLHEQFEEWAQRTPDAEAVRCGGRQIDYGTLNRRADALAQRLIELGVGPGARVALFTAPSIESVVGILGIHKAGAAYVPIDPIYPRERRNYIARDAGARVLVTERALGGELDASEMLVVALDDLGEALAARLPLRRTRTEEDPAYVIYTSGTTGRPKGTLVSHRNQTRLFEAATRHFETGQRDTWSVFHSFAFDFSVWEMWGALRQGARLLIVPQAVRSTPDALLDLLARERVTVLSQTPSAFYALADEMLRRAAPLALQLRYVVFGGEALDATRLREYVGRFGDQHPQLVNMYGITETTVHVTHHRVRAQDTLTSASVIGEPLDDLYVVLREPNGGLAPIGIPGELFVGGAGVSLGYLERPELTRERFLPSPYRACDRLYRSGDLAVRRTDGRLQYLGRVDRQVQLRGFRIELAEVEATLREQDGVRDAIASVRPDGAGGSRLVAHVVLHDGLERDAQGLSSGLRSKLPEYMVPSVYVFIDRVPLTDHGKVDFQALPEPGRVQARKGAPLVAPRTPLEMQIAALWVELLGLEQLSVDDDFFQLGGHSLLAASVIMRLRSLLAREVPVRLLFEHPTVARLSLAIAAHTEASESEARPDLSREAHLDADLQLPESQASARVPERVLLTGATGFFGAHLLTELMGRTCARVLCLVRAQSVSDARQRVHANLRAYGLWREDYADRIDVVLGDLARPRLGLSATHYQQLCGDVDAIYHNGAWVNFLEPYSRIAAVNVHGTREVVRLAFTGRTKPLHLISSSAVFGTIGYFEGRSLLREDDDIAIGKPYLYGGYAHTKWVSEQLVWEASRRGLPVTVFRCGLILGSSRSGASNTKDYPSRLIKGCIQLRAVFDLPRKSENFVPADIAAAAIVHLSRTPAAHGHAFHVVNPAELKFEQFWDILRGFGYSLEALPFHDWVDRLLNAESHLTESNALAPLVPLFMEKVSPARKTVVELFQNTPRFETTRFEAGLRDAGISCPALDSDLVGKWIAYYHRTGFVAAP